VSATPLPTSGPWAVAGAGGGRAAATALRDAVARDRLAHAWVLVGPEGLGQRELAIALAATLNCHAEDPALRPCGTCDACARTLRDVHPALVTLEPDGAAHRVEDVRGPWTEAALRTMPEARRKVLRVAAADRMNAAAQNAFLKLLEEPPPSVVWVLEAEDPGRLLETVLSRCRRVDLPPWSTADVAGWLAGLLGAPHGEAAALDATDRRRVVAAVAGARASRDRLRALRRDLAGAGPLGPTGVVGPDVVRAVLDEVEAARRPNLELLAELARGGPGAVVPTAKRLVAAARARRDALAERHAAEREALEAAFGVEGSQGWPAGVRARLDKRFERIERAEEQRALRILLDDLAAHLRDLLALASGAGPDALVADDAQDLLARDAGLLAPPDLLEALAAVGRCRAALDRNGAPELHLERLLLAVSVALYVRAAA
jgi:DNA polymerase-3 subunit delta'